jgi:hypothetical protein
MVLLPSLMFYFRCLWFCFPDLHSCSLVGGLQRDQRLRLRLLHGPHHRDRHLHHPHPQRRPRPRLLCPHGRLLPLPEEQRPQGHGQDGAGSNGHPGLQWRLQHLPGVDFINNLRAAFLYESSLHSFYVLTIWVCNFLAKGFWSKSCS